MLAALDFPLVGRRGDASRGCGNLCLLEKQLDFIDLVFVVGTVGHLVRGIVETTDDFVARGLATHLVVADAEANHVHAHVCGRLVGIFAVDALKQGVEHGENLHVAIVVDRRVAVGFEVERVDHVHVVEVGSGGFVGDVHGVFQRQVPHGEGLELGVSGADAALVFVVELRKAGGHFSAPRAWRGDDDELARGFHVVVFAESLVRGDELDVVRIAVDGVVDVAFDAESFQSVAELVGGVLAVVVGDDDASHHEVAAHEFVAQPQHVFVVGDAEVGANFVLFDVFGTDNDDNLDTLAQLGEHSELGVGLEAWQHARGVVVVEEFSAEFHVELAVELGDALLDVLRLNLQVFLVVESYFHFPSPFRFRASSSRCFCSRCCSSCMACSRPASPPSFFCGFCLFSS